VTFLCCLSIGLWPGALKAEPAARARVYSGNDRDATCRIIYLGFVGALELPENKHSGVVQIRDTLRGKEFPDVCARSYSPYTWIDGRDWLLTHFPTHTGVLTAAEIASAPKVILVGHSMGGWAAMSVARELRSRDIPVELTIQVDSVGITDYTIPRNVKSGAIFHARDALALLTTKHLRREDPRHTVLLADVRVAGVGHESITRDPRIRELVMQTIDDLRGAFALDLFLAGPAGYLPSALDEN
jgi:pimeloyl-ACP methyl ester carboxylesterase